MTNEQMLENLEVPQRTVDVVLDTDAYNEIDDQFAIAYLIRSPEKANIKAFYAAPFFNQNSKSPSDGMKKSYDEIIKVQNLIGTNFDVFKGSDCYLPNENTFVYSPAARDLVNRAKNYSPENPLYVIAIGAITNIASAFIIDPKIAQNTVVVWLGGHSREYYDTQEFNMVQDIAAARVVMNSGAAFVQLPCRGVVSAFTLSGADLEKWFIGKNKISDYLAKNTISKAEQYAAGKPWSRVIWDVTAIAWLLNNDEQFMKSRIVNVHLPEYSGFYSEKEEEKIMRYTYFIERDALAHDLVKKLTN